MVTQTPNPIQIAPTVEEADYTSSLKSAVWNYLKSKGQQRGLGYTPGNQAQGVDRWHSSKPYDLITWLKNGNLLVLEAKVQRKGCLIWPYEKQFRLNRALENVGHPIRYCFNRIDYYEDDESVLMSSQACRPSELYDKQWRLRLDDSATLHALLDSLVGAATGGGRALAQLIESGSLSSVNQMTGATILVVFRIKEEWLVTKLSELVGHISQLVLKIDPLLSIEDQVAYVAKQSDDYAQSLENQFKLELEAERARSNDSQQDQDDDGEKQDAKRKNGLRPNF